MSFHFLTDTLTGKPTTRPLLPLCVLLLFLVLEFLDDPVGLIHGLHDRGRGCTTVSGPIDIGTLDLLPPLFILLVSGLELSDPLVALLGILPLLDRGVKLLPPHPLVLVEDTAGHERQQRESLRVDSCPEHAVRLVVVSRPDRPCRHVQCVARRRAAHGDQWFLPDLAPQFLCPALLEEFRRAVEARGHRAAAER